MATPFIHEGCRNATIGCEKCKGLAGLSIDTAIGPMRQHREDLSSRPQNVWDALEAGRTNATKAAEVVMAELREATGLSRNLSGIRLFRSQADTERADSRNLSTHIDWLDLDIPVVARNLRELWRRDVVPSETQLKAEGEGTWTTVNGRRLFAAIGLQDGDGLGWQLMAKPKSYELLALLCWGYDNRLLDFIVPQKLFLAPWIAAKKAAGKDDIRFAVQQEGERFLLHLPSAEGIDITETRGSYGVAAETAPATPGLTLQLEPPPVLAPPPELKRGKKTEPEEASLSPFSVAIGQVYDGPFDLLLDLIRKQNLDIYDIPMARITAQFLEYTRHLQAVDVDAAGEFVYTASLLIHIKSRTLLPREPSTSQNLLDVEDPRRELVERLLEHERFKAAAQMLQQKQQIEEATWTKPGMKRFLNDEGVEDLRGEREIAADTVDLVRVFRDILERLRERPVHRIDEDAVTVAQMIDYTRRRLLMEDKPVSLRRLLRNLASERALICTFLAMLELVRLQAIVLRQTEALGDVLLKKTESFDEILQENAQVRDDWG